MIRYHESLGRAVVSVHGVTNGFLCLSDVRSFFTDSVFDVESVDRETRLCFSLLIAFHVRLSFFGKQVVILCISTALQSSTMIGPVSREAETNGD